jgi:hypothetical protein
MQPKAKGDQQILNPLQIRKTNGRRLPKLQVPTIDGIDNAPD